MITSVITMVVENSLYTCDKGFRVFGFRFTDQGLGFRLKGSGFRVSKPKENKEKSLHYLHLIDFYLNALYNIF